MRSFPISLCSFIMVHCHSLILYSSFVRLLVFTSLIVFVDFVKFMASNRTQRSSQVCKKCQRPVRGHVGPTGSSCSQPSSQFVTDTPSILPIDLANIQDELEASIRAHEDQINNLSAELGSLRLNSTPSSVPQQFTFAKSTEVTTFSPHGSGRPTSSVPATYAACTFPKMAAKEIATSFPPVPVAPPQFASCAVAPPPQPASFPAVPATSNPAQVMSLLHQLLQQFQTPATSVPLPQHSVSFPASAPASISDLRQNQVLKQQAHQLLGAIPVLESGGAGYIGNQAVKGKFFISFFSF